MKEYHDPWCATFDNLECNCIEYEMGYRATQMKLEEIENADDALTYALQTHLCYSNIMPVDPALLVLKERLDTTGYVLHKDIEKSPENIPHI